MPDPTGNLVFDRAVVAAEGARQAIVVPPNLQNNSGAGPSALPPPQPGPAATLQANISYFRSLLAAARATGGNPSPYILALTELGTGGQ